MADVDHYSEAAAGLEDAARALRACGDEETGEDQPKTLRGAAERTRQEFARSRKQRDSKPPKSGD